MQLSSPAVLHQHHPWHSPFFASSISLPRNISVSGGGGGACDPLAPPRSLALSGETRTTRMAAAADNASARWPRTLPLTRTELSEGGRKEGGTDERTNGRTKRTKPTLSLPLSHPPSRFLSRNDRTMERNIEPIVEKFSPRTSLTSTGHWRVDGNLQLKFKKL